jgi:hypothetical protein
MPGRSYATCLNADRLDAVQRSSLSIILSLAASSACGISSSSREVTKLETGTIRVTAFSLTGKVARNADIVIHAPNGEFYGRAKLDDNGTAVVDSIADATVSVAIFSHSGSGVVEQEDGSITTYTHVPLDASLQFNRANAEHGPETASASFEVPEYPGEDLYEVDAGCHYVRPYRGLSFEAHVNTGCMERPRTVVVSPYLNWWLSYVSVVRDVDLNQDGPIQIPPYEPARIISNSIVNLGDLYYRGGEVVLIDGDGRYRFKGPDHQPRVPPGDWEGTHYLHEVQFFDDGDEVRLAEIDYFDGGAAHDWTTDARDFLVPPTRAWSQGRFGFEFDGEPDARALSLSYGCLKCPSPDTQWDLFGPPIHGEAFTLPEMPRDLRSLTPVDDNFIYIVGETYDASEADGYAAWLGAFNRDVPNTTRTRSRIGLEYWSD